MLDIPANYDESTANKTQIRIREKEVDIHVNKKYLLNTNIGTLFSLIVVKWTESLKAKLRGLSTLQAIEYDNDAIGFLRAIIEVVFQFEAHENIHISLWKTKNRTVNTYHNHLDHVNYLEKVKVQGSISEKMNAGVWCDPVTTEAALKICKKW